MTVPRLLITGSRNWTDVDTINAALADAFRTLGANRATILVSGHCSDGADAICERIWRSRQMPVEEHPADWDKHGRRKAGPIRNAAMVALGADLCLAFVAPCTKDPCWVDGPHGSHGTRHCGALAEAADIPVTWYYQR